MSIRLILTHMKPGRRGWFTLTMLTTALLWGIQFIYQPEPSWLDAVYYYLGGAGLAQGRGLVDTYIWNYLPPPEAIVHPGFTYWMPLTSVVLSIPMSILGANYAAARVALVAMALGISLLSYGLTRHLGVEHRFALLACLLPPLGGWYGLYWASTDTFAPYTLVTALALFVLVRAGKHGTYHAVFAGAAIALAYLTRVDGILILGAAAIFLVMERQGWFRTVRTLGLILAGFLLVAGPWWLRNYAVMGGILPGNWLQAVLITDYNEIFSYDRAITLQTFLAQGWERILSLRLQVAGELLPHIGESLVWLPFVLVGAIQARHSRLFRGAGIYLVVLFLAMSIVFPFPATHNSFRHSYAALMPFGYAAMVAGVVATARWLSQGLRRQVGAVWRGEALTMGLGLLVLLVFGILTAQIIAQDPLKGNREQYTWYRQVAAELPAGAVVAVSNAPAYYYATGNQAISIPWGNWGSIRRAMQRYGVEYLVLQHTIREWSKVLSESDADRSCFQPLPTAAGGDIEVYRLSPVYAAGEN
jgi:4-amino-4-deoxy-L-arabinose transferase-like glycosyltransferase